MNTPPGIVRVLLTSMVCVAAVLGCEETGDPLAVEAQPELITSEAPRRSPARDPLTVMTRNLYHGGDIGPVLAVGFSDLKLLTETAAGVWAEIQANDFRERVAGIVDEIQAGDPDVVGLQEVALFVELSFNAATGATSVLGVTDFQAILEEELATRGMDYSFAAIQNNTQVSVPVEGFEMGDAFVPTKLVQLNVQDAILVRDDLAITGTDQHHYQAAVPLGDDPFGNPIRLLRGWLRVDLAMDGAPYHFVNTHLEIQSFAPIQVAQTSELLNQVVAGLDGVTVMTGDFNSDAEGQPGERAWTESYGMIRDAGFQDAWTESRPRKRIPGFTCCQASDLRNEVSALTERIDFVFIRLPRERGPNRHIPGPVKVDIVGEEAGDRVGADSIWPSDHAGVIVNLWLPPGLLH